METSTQSTCTWISKLVIALVVLLGACSEDPNPADILLGTWKVSSYDIRITVGTKTLVDYLKTELGLPEPDAVAYANQATAEFETAVFEKIDFARSGYWTATDASGTSRGTWLLSSDGKTLVLDKGLSSEVTLQVSTLTSSELVLALETTSDVEFNDTMTYYLEMKLAK